MTTKTLTESWLFKLFHVTNKNTTRLVNRKLRGVTSLVCRCPSVVWPGISKVDNLPNDPLPCPPAAHPLTPALDTLPQIPPKFKNLLTTFTTKNTHTNLQKTHKLWYDAFSGFAYVKVRTNTCKFRKPP